MIVLPRDAASRGSAGKGSDRRRAGRNAPRSPKGMRVVRNASGASVTLGLGTGSAQRQFSRREHPLNAPKTAHGIDAVVVNGTAIARNGEPEPLTGARPPGRLLRGRG